MNHREVGRCWNSNAEAWTRLARQGYDVYRDYLNTPAFLRMLPEVRELRGLDVGCGEGHNTRELARLGARMTAVDIAELFVKHAAEAEDESQPAIRYVTASAVELPFMDGAFDFVTGFMSFMDIPETDRVIAEAYRVLKRGGFLQFSINHPCFSTPHRRNLRDETGRTYAIEVGQYFARLDGDIIEGLFGAAPAEATEGLPAFRIPCFTRPLSEWINVLIDGGFAIERTEEPRPDDATVQLTVAGSL